MITAIDGARTASRAASSFSWPWPNGHKLPPSLADRGDRRVARIGSEVGKEGVRDRLPVGRRRHRIGEVFGQRFHVGVDAGEKMRPIQCRVERIGEGNESSLQRDKGAM